MFPNLSVSLAGIWKIFLSVKHFNVMVFWTLFLYTFNLMFMGSHTTKHIHMVGKQLHFKLVTKTIEQVSRIRL